MPLAKRLNMELGGVSEIIYSPAEIELTSKGKIPLKDLRQWKNDIDLLFEEGPIEQCIRRAKWRLKFAELLDRFKVLA